LYILLDKTVNILSVPTHSATFRIGLTQCRVHRRSSWIPVPTLGYHNRQDGVPYWPEEWRHNYYGRFYTKFASCYSAKLLILISVSFPHYWQPHFVFTLMNFP